MAAPTASQAVTSKKRGFFGLCSEVRNRIYFFVLTAPLPLSLKRHANQPNRYNRGPGPSVQDKRRIALLRCCRQTREEGMPIYYGCNTFEISGASDLLKFCHSQAIGSTRRSLIRHIVMQSYHMNITRAKQLRRLPSLKSVSVVYRPLRSDIECPFQDNDHGHFLTEGSAENILNDILCVPDGCIDKKRCEGFLEIIETRSNVACVLITSVNRYHDEHLQPNWSDHTFFNLSLDDADNRKLSATAFKSSTLTSEAQQSADLCR